MASGRNLLCGKVICLLLLFGGLAQAEETDSDAVKAIRLSGNLGLIGFMDMVDARTPGVLSIRTGSRYQAFVRDRAFETSTGTAVREERQHEIWTHLGLSFLGFIDTAARVPYIWDQDELDVRGGPDIEDHDQGWGDLDVAAKITLELGPFTVAPYVWGRIPIGEPEVRDLAELNYGAAGTFTLLNSYVTFHANLAGVQKETGISALRFRLGLAFSPYASESFLLRFYVYGDGIEYEGSAKSDIDADFGVQAILFETLTAEIGASLRILDADEVDDSLKRQLRGLDPISLQRHIEEDATWSVQIAIGTTF